MKALRLLSAAIPALLLLATGCDDSKNCLSDPKTSKPDERLFGVWREQGSEAYYHVGLAGEGFPSGMMRIVAVTHGKEKLAPPDDYLAFQKVLGGKTYLNVVLEQTVVKDLEEKGWKPDAVSNYTLVKYEVDGDRMTAWLMDEEAKEKAIKDGKIKGVIEDSSPSRFTDVADNVARFIGEAGESLWNKKEPGKFERVKTIKKQA